MPDLILTNGDSAAELLAAAGLNGRILPWRDILHEGPLMQASTLGAFSDIRARFLAERFGVDGAGVRADFIVRDALMDQHALFDRIAIWLEHDLYDQLQLLQILHFFHREGRTEGITLVQADDFITAQSASSVLRFAERAVAITPPMLDDAALAWNGVIATTPETAAGLRERGWGKLPFVGTALARFLKELPHPANGLSGSESALLNAITGGGMTPQHAFAALTASEHAAFMGDWSVFRLMDDLANAGEPLLAGLPGRFPCEGDEDARTAYLRAPLTLTSFGRAVLSGEADAIAVNGIDRWWGGTHMTGRDAWRWDSGAGTLVPPAGRASDAAAETRHR